MTTDRAQSTVLNGLLIIRGDAYSAKQPVDIIRSSACTLLQRLLMRRSFCRGSVYGV